MEPTNLKILRDAKLNDDTLVRWMTKDDTIILSVKRKDAKEEKEEDEFCEVVLPDSIEAAMELLTVARMMLQKNFQKELGKIV